MHAPACRARRAQGSWNYIVFPPVKPFAASLDARAGAVRQPLGAQPRNRSTWLTVRLLCRTQMDLDNNSTLQAVLKQRRMIQDSLRQAMTIQAGAKAAGGKGVPGAICFAWGAGSNGQLGQPVINGQLRSVNTPTVVKFEKLENSIVRVASGNGHVACVTDAGECYGWGDGRSGQLV